MRRPSYPPQIMFIFFLVSLNTLVATGCAPEKPLAASLERRDIDEITWKVPVVSTGSKHYVLPQVAFSFVEGDVDGVAIEPRSPQIFYEYDSLWRTSNVSPREYYIHASNLIGGDHYVLKTTTGDGRNIYLNIPVNFFRIRMLFRARSPAMPFSSTGPLIRISSASHDSKDRE